MKTFPEYATAPTEVVRASSALQATIEAMSTLKLVQLQLHPGAFQRNKDFWWRHGVEIWRRSMGKPDPTGEASQ